ncbi:MAG: HD domain-containing protein [Gammaproteobacteria bacterium]|nr:HD domain-containing protein [Gammaproteobacteria bacterium]
MSTYHVIKDPVHGTMQFTSFEDHWIKPFIDSPNCQRLRHIKQLGMGDYIFPGAVHTRFNHSLGCCYVASQIAQKIGLPDEERQLVMIAGLLHDIGHGPFSHTFEDLFHQKLIRHEDWTPYFLSDYTTDYFFQTYNALNPNYPLTDKKFNRIAQMIMHKTSVKDVLSDIVSSQLDADRLDYLLRDNHFCGVQYGEFDFRWMLHCLAIVPTPEGRRLGITHKGIGVVEHYVMARRLMIRNIYQSQKKLALENYLIQLLVLLAERIETHTAFASLQKTRLGQFLIAANAFNHAARTTLQPSLLKQQFLESNYQHYKALDDYDVFALLKQIVALKADDPVTQIAERLDQRKMPKVVRLEHVDIKMAEATLKEFKQTHLNVYQNWQLSLIRSPHQAYSRKEDPIMVQNEAGLVRPINELSLMIDALSDQYEHIAFFAYDHALAQDKRILHLVKELTAPRQPQIAEQGT